MLAGRSAVNYLMVTFLTVKCSLCGQCGFAVVAKAL